MRRKLRPSVVVTVAASSAVACGLLPGQGTDGTIFSNPPPLSRMAEFPAAPFYEGATLNPRHVEHGTVYMAGGKCWVHLPFDEPPSSWQPSPTEAVDCPEKMVADPAYTACEGGVISLRALGPPADCVCYFDGNPPPAPRDVQCPVLAIPDLPGAMPSANPPAVPPPTNPPTPSGE